MKWINMTDKNYTGLKIHEIKCPVCGYKVTYHNGKEPETCYVCNTELKGD